MAYIHNQQEIKVDDCDTKKIKEMFMKYGYGCPGNKYMCEDIDEQSVKKKPYPIPALQGSQGRPGFRGSLSLSEPHGESS